MAALIRYANGVSEVIEEIAPGWRVEGRRGRIGTVDAVFADYLLVRTPGLVPIDLYVPRAEVSVEAPGRLRASADMAYAHQRWRRPLRSAPHD